MKVSNIYNPISEDERFQVYRRILRIFLLSSGGSTENRIFGKTLYMQDKALTKKIPCQSKHRLRKDWRFQMKTQKFIRTKAIQERTQNAQTCRD